MNNLLSEIIDKEVLERIITSYLEASFKLPGFKVISIEREPNRIQWLFRRDVTKNETFTTVVATGPGPLFEAKEAVLFTERNPIFVMLGDRINIRYTLAWYWEGKNGDDKVFLSPTRIPGTKMTLVLTTAT